jgi:hypothetical protein
MRLQPRAQILFLSGKSKKGSKVEHTRYIEMCAPPPSKPASRLRVLRRWQPLIPASRRALALVACSGEGCSAPVLQQSLAS